SNLTCSSKLGSLRPSIFSAVAPRAANARTLLRGCEATARGVTDGRMPLPAGEAGPRGSGECTRFGGIGAAALGVGVSDVRPAVADSLSIAASSGNVRSGTHSSNPSRHTSDSSVMRPLAALRRRSLKRTGPTGTPLIPTYHSSVEELDESTAMAADTDAGSSFAETAFEKAPASPAPAAGA